MSAIIQQALQQHDFTRLEQYYQRYPADDFTQGIVWWEDPQVYVWYLRHPSLVERTLETTLLPLEVLLELVPFDAVDEYENVFEIAFQSQDPMAYLEAIYQRYGIVPPEEQLEEYVENDWLPFLEATGRYNSEEIEQLYQAVEGENRNLELTRSRQVSGTPTNSMSRRTWPH
jgi:hypothetical protein